jgi:hypothetical protein
MWDPQRLTTLWAFTAWYRDSFTLLTENEGRDTEEESSEASLTQEDQRHPEWTPDTRYLRRKIVREGSKSSRGASESPYALRSRSARTQFQEDRNESDSITLRAPQN